MLAHPTFYAKKWVYEKYGDYDLVYRRQSDFELTMRFLAIHKIKSAYIPRVLVRMCSGEVSQELMHILKGNIEAYVPVAGMRSLPHYFSLSRKYCRVFHSFSIGIGSKRRHR